MKTRDPDAGRGTVEALAREMAVLIHGFLAEIRVE
jgi:hypothetical protein